MSTWCLVVRQHTSSQLTGTSVRPYLEKYKDHRSGILLAMGQRIYTTNPDDVISLAELVGMLAAQGNTDSGMETVYDRMLELAGLHPEHDDELPAPTREQFLALSKPEKWAAIGVGCASHTHLLPRPTSSSKCSACESYYVMLTEVCPNSALRTFFKCGSLNAQYEARVMHRGQQITF